MMFFLLLILLLSKTNKHKLLSIGVCVLALQLIASGLVVSAGAM